MGRKRQQAGVQGRLGLLGLSTLGVWGTPLDWNHQGSMVKSLRSANCIQVASLVTLQVT